MLSVAGVPDFLFRGRAVGNVADDAGMQPATVDNGGAAADFDGKGGTVLALVDRLEHRAFASVRLPPPLLEVGVVPRRPQAADGPADEFLPRVAVGGDRPVVGVDYVAVAVADENDVVGVLRHFGKCPRANAATGGGGTGGQHPPRSQDRRNGHPCRQCEVGIPVAGERLPDCRQCSGGKDACSNLDRSSPGLHGLQCVQFIRQAGMWVATSDRSVCGRAPVRRSEGRPQAHSGYRTKLMRGGGAAHQHLSTVVYTHH
jgi:hypothetical protein